MTGLNDRPSPFQPVDFEALCREADQITMEIGRLQERLSVLNRAKQAAADAMQRKIPI